MKIILKNSFGGKDENGDNHGDDEKGQPGFEKSRAINKSAFHQHEQR